MSTKYNRVDPFEFGRLYGNEKYSLCNMLLNQAYFPYELTRKDTYFEIWSDRIGSDVWEYAGRGLKSDQNGDAWFAGLSSSDLLTWGTRMVSMYGWLHQATGIIVVRDTNRMSGYPCLRITVVSQMSNKTTYSGNSGPHVRFNDEIMKKKRKQFMDMFGRSIYGQEPWMIDEMIHGGMV